VLGFGDEVWWSRLAQPPMHTWTPGERELRLVEKSLPPVDSKPKALACYGVLLRATATTPEQLWLRFATGRPVSALTCPFLSGCCDRLAALDKRALLLVWDNASWHTSQFVRTWLRVHHRHVKRTGRGVRIVTCRLPSKSPWLNPIEPKWLHGKRAVVEPARVLTAQEVADASVDVVISNCVLNLSPDKPQVWRDIARVLKPGGRVAVSDVALLQPLPPAVAATLEALVGCVAGAPLVADTERMMRQAGLVEIHLEPKPEYVETLARMQDSFYRTIAAHLPAGTTLADYMTSLDITARKPS
jgi:hypothetical protein